MTLREGKPTRQYRRHICESGLTLAEYRRFKRLMESAIARARDEFALGAEPCPSIRDIAEKYIKYRRAGLGRRPCGEKTAALYRRRLLAFDRAFHSRPLDAISADDVEDWAIRRIEGTGGADPVSGDTVQADIDALKALARWALKKGLIPGGALPLLRADRVQTSGKIAGKNRRPPEIMEINALLDLIDRIKAVRPDIGLVLWGMFYFNIRPAGLLSLRRRELRLPVSGSDGLLDASRLKGLFDRSLPVKEGSPAHDWALECWRLAQAHGRPERGDAPLIICISGRSRRNPGGWTTDTLDKATARVCARLGVKFRPYMIRHSIITWLQDQPEVSAAAIQAHAAHSKRDTQEIYNHRVARDAAPAFLALDRKLIERRDRQTG